MSAHTYAVRGSSAQGWSTAGAWLGQTTGDRIVAAVDVLEPSLQAHEHLVWGGDWNQTMTRALDGSTRAGRDRLEQALDQLSLDLRRRLG